MKEPEKRMARPKGSFTKKPLYRKHKASGRGMVRIAGKDHYLPGPYGSTESKREYARLVAELASRGYQREGSDVQPITVAELSAAYMEHHLERIVDEGKRAAFIRAVRPPLAVLRKLYGDRPAAQFGPLAYRTVREEMTRQKVNRPGREDLTWSRPYVSQNMDLIKRMFKWAAGYELVPVSVPTALRMVEPLAYGRGGRETPAVKPADVETVELLISRASPTVADLLALQLYTGMRCGEACSMRAVDIDMTGDVWIYRPQKHKSQAKGKDRLIPLGPKAQEIVRRRMTLRPADPLFRSRESFEEYWRGARGGRDDDAAAKDRLRRERKRRACGVKRKVFAEAYSRGTYIRAVRKLCRRVLPVPEKIAGDVAKAREWKKAHWVHSHQLRHTFATQVRAEFGIEMARQLLGHSKTATTEIYAEKNLAGMSVVAAKIG